MTVGELYRRLGEAIKSGEISETDPVFITRDAEGNRINGVAEAMIDPVESGDDGWEIIWDESGDRMAEPVAGSTAAMVLWADR